MNDVVFRDCDIIHDFGREWSLRVYHCDSARVSNVRFEDLRIEEAPRLISLWIDKAFWTRDAERGHIDNVVFRNIKATTTSPPRIELKGYDNEHVVRGVTFDRVTVNGSPVKNPDIKTNAFVREVTFTETR